MASGDLCLKCGESRGAIRREGLICWDGYDELGKHRFKPWDELDDHERQHPESLNSQEA